MSITKGSFSRFDFSWSSSIHQLKSVKVLFHTFKAKIEKLRLVEIALSPVVRAGMKISSCLLINERRNIMLGC